MNIRLAIPVQFYVIMGLFIVGCSSPTPLQIPGGPPDGRIQLPNGWILSPAGKQLTVGELPLNLEVTPDGKFAMVVNNGTSEHSISLIDVDSWTVAQSIPIRKAWLGLRLIDGGRTVIVSGGNDNRLFLYSFENNRLVLRDSVVIAPPWPQEKIWLGGLDFDPSARVVYVVGKQNATLYKIDLTRKAVIGQLKLPATPYTCLLSGGGKTLYVSLWGGAAVAWVDKGSMTIKNTVTVGEHPTDLTESADGGRLFVANANQNTVSVIDTRSSKVAETINTALSPNAPPGSTPNALALSSDGTRLYVANADNNYLAVIDVHEPGKSRSLGFIPVGWYPTSVRVVPATGKLLVTNGKGSKSQANPQGPIPGQRGRTEEYIGSLFRGSVSLIDPPGAQDLTNYTQMVYRNSLYTDQRKDKPHADESNPVPGKTGGTSPIKHIFYIIKENRTYDQVFGDLPQGNGDSTLCLFPDSVTPNHHALAKEFVLLDNFYADAEVSADGHNWSMGAYATDYTEKTWPTMYGGRGGEYEYEGGHPIVYPSSGYLWDNCQRHGVSYRSYGEFAENGPTRDDSVRGLTPALVGHVAPFYRGWDLEYSDVDRVKSWEREFSEFERNGNLPQFQIIKLPNDHTEGTRKGSLTPRAFVAQNDLALGMIVERISRSRFWNESAIFVIEDDAQNGPDHVDAHRTVALVVSPFTKRGFVDSELYSTSSMVRTIGLILGLPPLSQFDAAATPMFASFASTATLTPYTCRPARINLDERNPDGAYGQKRSGEMDFSAQDRIPDVELSEIVWKAIRGADSAMPAPVRSAFVKVVEAD